MAEPLKNFYNDRLVRSLAKDLAKVSDIDERSFVGACVKGLAQLELTPRAWHIAEVLRTHLPPDFRAAAHVLVKALGPRQEQTEQFGMEPFRYLPFVFYVQKYGLSEFEAAMQAQYEITKRMSAESSIRAYLVAHPAATYERLRLWARDPDPHVRRLVSEGTRPRLPWAPRLPDFVRDPRPVLALLELLKDDPVRYVQRSVANNLNDIGKDHPELAVETCKRWFVGATPARDYIVRHALRSLVKRGHRGALRVLGAGGKPRIHISDVRWSAEVVGIGGSLRFDFQLSSRSRATQQLIVDYAVHYVKANGSTRAKVFKLKNIRLEAGGSVPLGAKLSLLQRTTRTHYAGRHRVELLINGLPHSLGEFELLQTPATKSRGRSTQR